MKAEIKYFPTWMGTNAMVLCKDLLKSQGVNDVKDVRSLEVHLKIEKQVIAQ